MPSNSPISADDVGVLASSTKRDASYWRFSRRICGLSKPLRTQSRIAYGAGILSGAADFATAFFASENTYMRPGAKSSVAQRAHDFFLPGAPLPLSVPAASSFAQRTARPSSDGRSHVASTSPSFFALSARTSLPWRMSGSAFVRPSSRGRFCVPPQPGSRPSLTSGSPSFVLGLVVHTR